MPLDFVYDLETGEYQLDRYKSDEELVEKIQTGIGDPALFLGNRFLDIEGIFGGTDPSPVDQ